jgi:DNA-binding Lrp family transcriptional regulator
MSVEAMGQVWKMHLDPGDAWVLMAMADHADVEGEHVFPSVGRIAWKTGFSQRTVQRAIKRLRKLEVLELVTANIGEARRYRIIFANAKYKKPWPKGGVTLSPPSP